MDRQREPEYMDLDDEALAYAEADFSEVNAAFCEALLAAVPERGPALALDLGCGPADIPLRVARARPAWHIVGVDASAAMLRLGRAALDGTPNVSLVRTDAKALPFQAGAFNVVMSNSILHHVADAEAFWRAVGRVSRPGTAVFLRDLMRPDSEAAAQSIVDTYAGEESELLREEYYRSLLAAYTVDEVRTQLAAAGLGGLRVQAVTDRHLDVTGRLG